MKQLAECLPHYGGSVIGCDNDDGDDNGDYEYYLDGKRIDD